MHTLYLGPSKAATYLRVPQILQPPNTCSVHVRYQYFECKEDMDHIRSANQIFRRKIKGRTIVDITKFLSRYNFFPLD